MPKGSIVNATAEQDAEMRSIKPGEYGIVVNVEDGTIRVCVPPEVVNGGGMVPAIGVALAAIGNRLANDEEWMLAMASEVAERLPPERLN